MEDKAILLEPDGSFVAGPGYFAGLEDVEVHCFSVKDEPASLGQTKVIYH